MAKKRYNAEEIIHKFREAEVLLAQGSSIAQACKQLGVTDQTYYRWRKSCGGMKVDQANSQSETRARPVRRVYRPVTCPDRIHWPARR